MRKLQTIMIATTLFIGAAIPAGAQQPPSPAAPPTTPYGPPIGLDAAKKAMAAAEAEANAGTFRWRSYKDKVET